jgi:DNA (cytosine-5)-methyltransferase 1
MENELSKNVVYCNEFPVSLFLDSEQLNLFEKYTPVSNVQLKYPRRTKRKISDNTFEIDAPTEKVSNTMQKIRSSNTAIELLLEQELIYAKLKYAKPKQIIEPVPGNPDFVIPRYRIAIFCDGDFWHGYNLTERQIKSNAQFWVAKIERNMVRDTEVTYSLRNREWKVFRFWEHEIKSDARGCVEMIKNYINELQIDEKYDFTFVDLFAGIGGFRIPLERLGGKCLGFSEIDKPAIDVYKSNFFEFNNTKELELGDITKLGKLAFSNIDLIVGGVPCQAWSVAGKRLGFDDPRGKLWNDTIRVVSMNKPRVFIFENVKGLMDPRNQGSLNLIIESFENAGYKVKHKLLNSYDFGLPQNRDRIFIVGIRDDLKNHFIDFKFPAHIKDKLLLKDLFEINDVKELEKKTFTPEEIFGEKIPMGRNRFQQNNQLNDFFVFCDTRNGHTTIHSWDIIKTSIREKQICMVVLKNRRKKIYGTQDGNPLSFEVLKSLIPDLKPIEVEKLLSKKILRYVQDKGYEFVNSKNSAGINGIYRIYLPHSKIFSTLTATGTKDMVALTDIDGETPEKYRENFINEIVKKKFFRQITAKEYGKLQGFPKWFAIHKDEKLAKKQFGNAVSTNVIYNLSKSVLKTSIFDSDNKCNEQDRQGKNN